MHLLFYQNYLSIISIHLLPFISITIIWDYVFGLYDLCQTGWHWLWSHHACNFDNGTSSVGSGRVSCSKTVSPVIQIGDKCDGMDLSMSLTF